MAINTRLHREQLTQPWVELSDEERQLDALRREHDLHQSHYQRNQNRLEAYLSRHWPEVDDLLALHSVTLESLLIEYGSPSQKETLRVKALRVIYGPPRIARKNSFVT